MELYNPKQPQHTAPNEWEAMQSLKKGGESSDYQQYVVSKGDLALMQQREVDDLLAQLKRDAIQRKDKRVTLPLMLAVQFLFLGLLIGTLPIRMFGVLFVTYTCWFLWTQRLAPRKRIAHNLTFYNDIRAVGPLAEALEYRDVDLREQAKIALIRLLPRLQASDAVLFTTEQRNRLYRALNSPDVEFVLAILKALEQIGDAKALPYVEKLASGGDAANGEERVRRAAQACLPYLRERAERETPTLLRAASVVESAPNSLLRPAAAGNDAEPEQLLRASAGQTDE